MYKKKSFLSLKKKKGEPQSGGKKVHKADLCDFNVVLRGRLAQSCQIWVLRPAVGKQIAAEGETGYNQKTRGEPLKEPFRGVSDTHFTSATERSNNC